MPDDPGRRRSVAASVVERVALNTGLVVVADVRRVQDPAGTVVLLHGGGQTRHSWGRTAERIARRGWRTATVDARGHGDSSWAPDRDYSLNAMVGDLRAMLARLDGPPVLVGASMGGCVALLAEGERPGTARALVLVDVVPRIEPDGARRIEDFMRSASAGFASLDEVAAAIAAYNPHRQRPPSVEGLRRNVRLEPDGRWHWHWDPALLSGTDMRDAEATRRRLSAAAAAVTVPTLLVRGSESDIVSPSGAEEFRALVPHAETLDVAEAGHMVAGDDNDRFAGGLVDFLARLPAVGGPRA